MTIRAFVVGFVLATREAVREFFDTEHPKAVVEFVQDVQCPPYFYIKIDEQVIAVKL
jgi:hypothetical protein